MKVELAAIVARAEADALLFNHSFLANQESENAARSNVGGTGQIEAGRNRFGGRKGSLAFNFIVGRQLSREDMLPDNLLARRSIVAS